MVATPTTPIVQFIGCTSMSEAFHRLDLARAVRDVRRFNYVCKVNIVVPFTRLSKIWNRSTKQVTSPSIACFQLVNKPFSCL